MTLRRLTVYTRFLPTDSSKKDSFPRQSHRLSAALFRVLKTLRPGIQNQLFQTSVHSWRISKSVSWVPQSRLSRRKRQLSIRPSILANSRFTDYPRVTPLYLPISASLGRRVGKWETTHYPHHLPPFLPCSCPRKWINFAISNPVSAGAT